jgi:hypothetical protein
MKRRSTLVKVAILISSLALFAGYVTARGMGWIGRDSAPAVSPDPVAPNNATNDPAPPQEFFGGSKSAQVLTPAQTKTLLPSSKVLMLDPLPPTSQNPAPSAPATPAAPSTPPK